MKASGNKNTANDHGAASLSTPTGALQDEILQLCRETGIESIAKEVGVIKNGEVPALKEYSASSTSFAASLGRGVTASLVTSSSTVNTNKHALKPDSGDEIGGSSSSRKRKKLSQNSSSNSNANSSSNLNSNNSSSNNNINNNTNINSTLSKMTPLPIADVASPAAGGGSSLGISLGGPGANKGLRHFSLKVCQKVESKKTTSYNEVADELVGEFASETSVSPVDQKNIRRRVYDVLNVLMAMNIISKDKKEIHWIGVPTNNDTRQEDELRKEKTQRMERIKKKLDNLTELQAQQISYRNLLTRNAKPDYSSTDAKNRIYLPFIVVNTKSNTVINCEVVSDRSRYFFNFSQPFAIHDDNEILRRMGMGNPNFNNEVNTQTTTPITTTLPPPPPPSSIRTTNNSNSNNNNIVTNIDLSTRLIRDLTSNLSRDLNTDLHINTVGGSPMNVSGTVEL